MRLRTEALLISAALWFVGVGVVTGRVNGLSLLGFYPLLLRVMGDEMKTLRRHGNEIQIPRSHLSVDHQICSIDEKN